MTSVPFGLGVPDHEDDVEDLQGVDDHVGGHDDDRRQDAGDRSIRRNTCNSDAPSIRAASMISSGIDLIAADSTTMANPVCIQTMITISKRLFHGCCCEPGDWVLAQSLP